ncbi:MAG: chemotaxis protein CheB [Bacteroidota bacterium]
MEKRRHYKAVVVGTSAGGLYALMDLLQPMSPQFALPVIIVQHRSKDQSYLLEDVLQSKCRIRVKQADEKEKIMGGIVLRGAAGLSFA